jgi:hypothetical protein
MTKQNMERQGLAEMALKTEGVRILVQKAIMSVLDSDDPDVTEEVALVIEAKYMPEWNILCSELGTDEVRKALGRWTSKILGRSAGERVRATRSTIIKNYSRLP